MSLEFKQKLQLDWDLSQNRGASVLQNLVSHKCTLSHTKLIKFTYIGLISYHTRFIYTVPTEPRDLTVQYLNSLSLEITWNHPLCGYGARTNYTVSIIIFTLHTLR